MNESDEERLSFVIYRSEVVFFKQHYKKYRDDCLVDNHIYFSIDFFISILDFGLDDIDEAAFLESATSYDLELDYIDMANGVVMAMKKKPKRPNCFDEDGKRKGFPIFRNQMQFLVRLQNNFKIWDKDYENTVYYTLIDFFISYLKFGLEDITKNEFRQKAEESEFQDFAEFVIPVVLKNFERARRGKNNYPLSNIPGGENVGKFLDENIKYNFEPKRKQLIAEKLNEENLTIYFLEMKLKELRDEGKNDYYIGKLFSELTIFQS